MIYMADIVVYLRSILFCFAVAESKNFQRFTAIGKKNNFAHGLSSSNFAQ